MMSEIEQRLNRLHEYRHKLGETYGGCEDENMRVCYYAIIEAILEREDEISRQHVKEILSGGK